MAYDPHASKTPWSEAKQRRAEYMDNYSEATDSERSELHHAYYLWLAQTLKVSAGLLPSGHTESTDPHFNDVPLHLWDARDGSVRRLVTAYFYSMPESGPIVWSLSDSVCVLKAYAEHLRRQRVQA